MSLTNDLLVALVAIQGVRLGLHVYDRVRYALSRRVLRAPKKRQL